MEGRLNKWMILNTNGDWEHENGIRLTSTDVPGWYIEIDLRGTSLESAEFRYIDERNISLIDAKIENYTFKASCSLSELNDCLSLFFDKIIPEQNDTDFEYQVFVPIKHHGNIFWKPIYGSLTNDLKFKVTRIPKLIVEDIKAKTIEILTQTVFKEMIDVSIVQIGKEYDVVLEELYDGNYPVIPSSQIQETWRDII